MGVRDGRLLNTPIRIYYRQPMLLLGGNMQDKHSKAGQNQSIAAVRLKANWLGR